MFKAIKFLKYSLFSITLCFLMLIIYSFYTVPDELYSLADEEIRVNDFYTVSYSESEASKLRQGSKQGNYTVEIKLFNAIPIKNSLLTVSDRKYVAISGQIIGLRLFTDGVLIVGIDSVETPNGTVSPGEEAGLRKGDIICSINGIATISSAGVNDLISQSEGRVLEVEYVRDSKRLKTQLTPALSLSEQKYRGGMWVRDSAAGIGTMTFYDKSTGEFAALGHAVCDIDTGEILPLSNGDIVSAGITNCTKGKSGKAGELCGAFTSDTIGELYKNTQRGIFGVLQNTASVFCADEVPVATQSEIKKGSAQIISTVDSSGPQYYDIEITKISDQDSEYKNMVIKVTDAELIEKTGGIVQGMSGSPIVQDGKLVGAVTHVLVNDPSRGYGIFIENMLEAAA